MLSTNKLISAAALAALCQAGPGDSGIVIIHPDDLDDPSVTDPS